MHEKRPFSATFFCHQKKVAEKTKKKSLSKKMHFCTSDFENYHLRKK